VTAATLLVPLAEDPARSALLFDVDGTLAPIVARPELATVPPETRSEIARLSDRYLLVACLSGRSGAEAERLVAVPGVRYVGNHGLELEPDAEGGASVIARFRERIDGRWPVEDKHFTLALHFREAENEDAARTALLEIAAEADAEGLDARWGRKVLEIRPRIDADKGTAVRRLLEESGARRGLYAGDDTTDLDAFRGLANASLETAVRVAVDSAEAPWELLDEADVVVDGPGALLDLLRGL
jgi:trehalose 6-phosphate phosphatase